VQAEHRLNLARQIGKMATRINRQFLATSNALVMTTIFSPLLVIFVNCISLILSLENLMCVVHISTGMFKTKSILLIFYNNCCGPAVYCV